MKRFTVPCDFGGQLSPFVFYIGEPKKGEHPLQNQSAWLSKERGGTVPANVMESLTKLQKIAEETGISLESLCDVIQQDESTKIPDKKVTNNQKSI